MKDKDTIVIENTIDSRTNYYLPRKIIAKVDGTYEELSVKWDEDNKIRTYLTGDYTYNGKILDCNKNVQLKLNIMITDMNVSFSTNVYTYAGYVVQYIVETYGTDKLNVMIRNGGNLSTLDVSESKF